MRKGGNNKEKSMSKKQDKAVDYEKRTDTIVGLITIAVVIALSVWLLVSMTIRGSAITIADSAGNNRRGSEQTFSATVNSPKIKDGDKVTWIVNGQVVGEGVYAQGTPLTLNYTPTQLGDNFVTVRVGKYSKSAYMNVLPPVLTVSAPNITVTYGDKLPNFKYDCCGFVDGDCPEMMEYDGICYLCDSNDSELNCSKLNVGVYKLNMQQTCSFKDYEVEYVGGTLTVLPKKISACGDFVKTYDQSNVIENPNLKLAGVEDGDNVTAVCDKLYFDNKNAGVNKTIMLSNVCLEGEDSCNYVLEGTAYGNILPKEIQIDGLTIRDKQYDGTTRAQIERMGTLNGIIDGDSVAIGNLQLSFEQADVGTQQIKLDSISLIGADKDNYFVSGIDVEQATINDTVWNKIFIKNPVIGATK